MECFRNHRRFSSSLWINNEVIHIYILSYTCEVLFFLIHNEQTVKILNIDCFLSSHYQTETRSNKLHAAMRDNYLLSEVYNIPYHATWWYSELRLYRTSQFYDIHRQRFQCFPGYISLTLSYWFQSLVADFHTMFLSAQSWSWNILAGDRMI